MTRDRIAVFFDPRVLDHDTGAGVFEAAPSPYLEVAEPHPENAARIRNMRSVLERGPLADRLDWPLAATGADEAAVDDMALFHDRAYLESLAAMDADTAHSPTSTTVFGPGSWPIVRTGAGLAIAAARHVWTGEGTLAYALTRPPGHHAQPAVADGYCFINNIGVALNVLRRDHG
jgi:acetoin utilization deacetylase AcuC-like enzyme